MFSYNSSKDLDISNVFSNLVSTFSTKGLRPFLKVYTVGSKGRVWDVTDYMWLLQSLCGMLKPTCGLLRNG